jgi:tetratricopeptide (TPR) repeat protein
MTRFLLDGWWIPVLLFAAAVLYSLWLVLQKLEQLRGRDRLLESELGNTFLQYRAGLERLRKANEWMESGDPKRAIQEFQDIQRALPGLSATHFFLGKAHLAEGSTRQAREHFQAFVQQTRPYDPVSRERLEEAQAALDRLSGPGPT